MTQHTKIDIYSIIGSKIRAVREQRGITQNELSNLIGINRASLSNIESGKQRCTIKDLYLLSKSLSISIFTLLPTDEEINLSDNDIISEISNALGNNDIAIRTKLISILRK